MPSGTYWSPENTDALRQLAEVDGLSAGLIAERIGRSRNSIIGRCHRMGIKLSGEVHKHRPVNPRPRRVRAPRAPRLPIFRPAKITKPHHTDIPAPVSLELAILDLRHNNCRWIDGRTYCGHTTLESSSWCSYHDAVTHKREED